MAHYQKRGKNSFLLVVDLGRDGRGKRIRKTKTIRVEDESLLRTRRRLDEYLKKELYKFQVEVETGEYIDTKNLKFKDFVDDWIKRHAKRNLAKRTLQNYKEKLKNYILPYFGNDKIEDIKAMHIVMFLDELSKPGMAVSGRKESLSSATIYEIDKTLRVIFNKAVEWQVIKESPMKNLSRPKIEKREMTIYNEEDLTKLIEALYKEHVVWRIYFLTAALAGMRRGEVIALQWNNVDFDNDCIVLNKSIPFFEDGKPHLKGTKTNERERIIYMPKWYMKELKKFKKFWDEEKHAAGDKWIGGNDEYLYHDGFGKVYTPSQVNKMWGAIVERHDLKYIRPHDLRHTMITYLLNRGESPFNVSKRAGHSDVKITTDIYGHADEFGGKSSAKHLERFKIDDLDNNWTTEPIFIDSE